MPKIGSLTEETQSLSFALPASLYTNSITMYEWNELPLQIENGLI